MVARSGSLQGIPTIMHAKDNVECCPKREDKKILFATKQAKTRPKLAYIPTITKCLPTQACSCVRFYGPHYVIRYKAAGNCDGSWQQATLQIQLLLASKPEKTCFAVSKQ